MNETENQEEIYYLIDTNIFIDNPEVLETLSYGEKILLPAEVIQELDKKKKDFKYNKDKEGEVKKIAKSIRFLTEHKNDRVISVPSNKEDIPDWLKDKNYGDNNIIGIALKYKYKTAIVTNDNALNLKASIEIPCLTEKEFVDVKERRKNIIKQRERIKNNKEKLERDQKEKALFEITIDKQF